MFHHGWWYWSRSLAGKQYPVHCRRADPGHVLSVTEVLAAARAALPGAGVAGDGAPAPAGDGPSLDNVRPHAGEVVLDENQLAGTGDYFALGVFDIQPTKKSWRTPSTVTVRNATSCGFATSAPATTWLT